MSKRTLHVFDRTSRVFGGRTEQMPARGTPAVPSTSRMNPAADLRLNERPGTSGGHADSVGHFLSWVTSDARTEVLGHPKSHRPATRTASGAAASPPRRRAQESGDSRKRIVLRR